MTSTFPRIEFSKEDGKVIAKLAISEEGFAMWHLSKKAVLEELQQKTEARRITYHQAFELAENLLSNKDFDDDYTDEETDGDLRNLFNGLMVGAGHVALLDFMKTNGNPYSAELAARNHRAESWTDQGQAEVFFSGPNFSSRPFSNKQAAQTVIKELLGEEKITRTEAQHLGMIIGNLNLPEKAPLRPDAN